MFRYGRTRKFSCVLIPVMLGLVWLRPAVSQFKMEPKPNPFSFDEKKKIKYTIPIRYNRVEGFVPAAGIKLRKSKESPLLVGGDFGYGLKSEEINLNTFVEYESPSWQIFKVGAKYFDDTSTKDDWVIPSVENSLAALFLREDFRDYYRTRGFSLWAAKDFQEFLHFHLSFWSGEYEAAQKLTEWSLFGGDKKFRANPIMAEGDENRLRLEMIIDKLDNPMFPLEGWYFEGAIEKGGDFLGGDFDHESIYAMAKYMKPTISNHKAVVTGRVGWSNSAAPQHLMDMGGISTLKGYRFKEYQNGNRMAFGSIQYYFNGDILQNIPLQSIPLYSSLGLVVFAEAGALWNTELGSINIGDSADWKWDAGFALTVTGDFIRVDFARRLDRSDGGWTVTFRLLPKI